MVSTVESSYRKWLLYSDTTISHKILWHNPFFLKKYAYSPPPLSTSSLFNVEKVKNGWNCWDGCLVHLTGLKLNKSTLKLGKGSLCQGRGFVSQFLYVIVRKSKIILTAIYLSRCFQTFLNKLTNKVHTLHTVSTGSPNLIYLLILYFSLKLQRVAPRVTPNLPCFLGESQRVTPVTLHFQKYVVFF